MANGTPCQQLLGLSGRRTPVFNSFRAGVKPQPLLVFPFRRVKKRLVPGAHTDAHACLALTPTLGVLRAYDSLAYERHVVTRQRGISLP